MTTLKVDKLMYTEFTVLNILKLAMYNFYYNKLKDPDLKLLYMGTNNHYIFGTHDLLLFWDEIRKIIHLTPIRSLFFHQLTYKNYGSLSSFSLITLYTIILLSSNNIQSSVLLSALLIPHFFKDLLSFYFHELPCYVSPIHKFV